MFTSDETLVKVVSLIKRKLEWTSSKDLPRVAPLFRLHPPGRTGFSPRFPRGTAIRTLRWLGRSCTGTCSSSLLPGTCCTSFSCRFDESRLTDSVPSP